MKLYRMEEANLRLNQDAEQFAAWAESVYDKQIEQTAKQITRTAKERPVILISGPSGSAKTSTALRLEQLLDNWGLETHTISMDNYFKGNAEEGTPVDEDGNLDLESPQRLDITLLNQHLYQIARCEPVEIPSFDFSAQRRIESATPLHRRPGELVILEGIHALNPDVTGKSADFSTGIYVSVRTRVMDSSGALLHPEKIRLLRRLLRDSLYRGQSFLNTITRLKSVSRGENLYIMPHKHRAQLSIDTFLPYELAVYRDELLIGLEELGRSRLAQYGVTDVLDFLRQSSAFPKEAVPPHSILREFIGEAGL
ncbi:nucleoside kinase [Clostridiaceae bacterium NSJ-31]|uniref:Nucleoside kinase n=1 Tax=Ligaoa zhengdingensis TaxID=2763658 RepID=A0A926DZB8_9FIRM|nr:nucleoside kinase [Ligaoa zhengdingensis]MBC8546703.1 nucleoside kinase [Ligaoa zhengdingensis]